MSTILTIHLENWNREGIHLVHLVEVPSAINHQHLEPRQDKPQRLGIQQHKAPSETQVDRVRSAAQDSQLLAVDPLHSANQPAPSAHPHSVPCQPLHSHLTPAEAALPLPIQPPHSPLQLQIPPHPPSHQPPPHSVTQQQQTASAPHPRPSAQQTPPSAQPPHLALNHPHSAGQVSPPHQCHLV